MLCRSMAASSGTINARSARPGTVWMTPATASAGASSHGILVAAMPSGSALAALSNSAINVSCRWAVRYSGSSASCSLTLSAQRTAARRRPPAAAGVSINSRTYAESGRLRRSRGVPTCSSRPSVHHRDPVAQQQRLRHVVRDEYRGQAEFPADAPKRFLQALPRERIERAERLVEEHDGRAGGERPRHADALLLAAGQRRPGAGPGRAPGRAPRAPAAHRSGSGCGSEASPAATA